MAEELNANTTPPAADASMTPVPASSLLSGGQAAGNVPLEMSPTIETIPAPAPAPEPIAPMEPAPTPVSPALVPPVSPAPIAPPPVPESPIRSLLAKAMAKIQFRKGAKLEKIMAKAREQGSIGNDEAQKLLRVSDATATSYLAQLTKSGRLRLTGKSKAARYMPVQ